MTRVEDKSGDEAQETSAVETPSVEKPSPRRNERRQRRQRLSVFGLILSLTFAGVLLGILMLAQTGQTITLPDDARDKIEAQAIESVGHERFSFGQIRVALGRDFAPRFVLENVNLATADKSATVAINEAYARVNPLPLLGGRVEVTDLVLSGAQATLRRASDGSFGQGAGDTTSETTVTSVLTDLETALNSGALSALSRVEANGVVIALEDARSGRIWQATNAMVVARKQDDALRVGVTTDVFNGTDDLARLQMSLELDRAGRTATMGATLDGLQAEDIALQAPALSWLSVLDAPLSGSVRAAFDETGMLSDFAGTLNIQKGALSPADVRPVPFDSARAYFSFDPERQRMTFSEVSVVSPVVSLSATGHADLTEVSSGWPGAFVGQFDVSSIDVRETEVFVEPLTLSDVSLDMRLRLAPFAVELAQLSAVVEGKTALASGSVTTQGSDWVLSLDASVDAIAPNLVVAYWPVVVAPGTRNWLENNILSGNLTNVSAGVRHVSGSEPDISLSFDYDDGTVQFLGTMPPVVEAAGRATLGDRAFTIVVEDGYLESDGVRIDGTGTVFKVEDIREKPAKGQVSIRADGPIPALLRVLDRPPLRVLSRVGRTTDIADGAATVNAEVSMPLKRGIRNDDVSFDVAATLRQVASATLVPGRDIIASALQLRATPSAVEISGPVTLSDVPVVAAWQQPIGADTAPGRIDGTVTISNATLASLGISLPDGLMNGQGEGQYSIDFQQDGPPELRVTSDLEGIGLSIPALAYAKPRNARGGLELTATLGETPEVTSLELSAGALSLDGRIALTEGGQVAGMEFNQLRVGRWLDASVVLTPRGAGQSPAVALNGGTFDLREFEFGGGGAAGAGAPIRLALDRLIVSDGITVTGARGRLDPVGGGLSGEIRGRLNGQTPIAATLAPAPGGTAIRVRAEDAGGAVRDAGFTPNARGGTLDLTLVPVSGAPGGTYDGTFKIEAVNLRKAPAVADLLDAISVVGLLDQLDGPGIRFDTVDGRFRMTPDRLVLQEAAAVGASMGISAEGVFDLAQKRLDVQGVVSPVYFVNSIGSIFSRRGEGLFGFNYRMSGNTASPEVGVNPLSILTPGMFREIFRRPPPEG